MDSVAHKKNLILKSYQSAELIELLHYHQCDSRAATKAEHLKCLLSLQIQHIQARFAVFLTGKLTAFVRAPLETSKIRARVHPAAKNQPFAVLGEVH